jgi:hypothetical protein
MDVKSAERLAVARRATRVLRHRDFRSALARPGDRDRPGVVIAALPGDRVGMVFERVERYREPVNVVLPAGDRMLQIMILVPCTEDSPRSSCDECPVHDDAEIGMLFDYMRAHRAPIHIVRTTEFSMELVDDGGEVPCSA